MKDKIWKLLGLLLIMVFTFSAAASVHAESLITTITLHNGPEGVAYDPSKREVFVANILAGDIQVFSDSTNQQVADITALTLYAGPPYDIAYDSGKGEMWVTDQTGEYAISDATNMVVANVTGSVYASGELCIAYDSGKGELFVAYNTTSVQVISDSSNTIIANITTSDVFSLVYDSAKGEIFASETNANTGAINIAVISDTTNSIITTIPVTTVPGSLVYDPGKGEIFVLTAPSTPVVISDSSNKIVATLSNLNVSNYSDMAYDSGRGEIYVNGGNVVQIISDSTNELVGTVNTTGTYELGEGIAYDSGTGTIYAISYGGGNAIPGRLAVISDGSPIPEFSNVALILTLTFATSAIVLAARKSPRRRIQLAYRTKQT